MSIMSYFIVAVKSKGGVWPTWLNKEVTVKH